MQIRLHMLQCKSESGRQNYQCGLYGALGALHVLVRLNAAALRASHCTESGRHRRRGQVEDVGQHSMEYSVHLQCSQTATIEPLV